jgi:hypothetical protein
MLRASCVVNVDAGVDDDGEDREEDGHLVDEGNDVEDVMVAVWKCFLRVACIVRGLVAFELSHQMSIKGDHLQFSKTTENFAFCRQSSITSCVLVENASIAPAVTILHQSLNQFVFTNSVTG